MSKLYGETASRKDSSETIKKINPETYWQVLAAQDSSVTIRQTTALVVNSLSSNNNNLSKIAAILSRTPNLVVSHGIVEILNVKLNEEQKLMLLRGLVRHESLENKEFCRVGFLLSYSSRAFTNKIDSSKLTLELQELFETYIQNLPKKLRNTTEKIVLQPVFISNLIAKLFEHLPLFDNEHSFIVYRMLEAAKLGLNEAKLALVANKKTVQKQLALAERSKQQAQLTEQIQELSQKINSTENNLLNFLTVAVFFSIINRVLYFTTDKIIASKSKDAEKKDKKEKKEINETNETNELIRSAMVGSIGKIKNLVLDYGLYLDTKGKLTKLGDEESLTMAIALGKQFENYLEHAASDEKFKSLSSHFADIASNHPVKLSKSTSPRHSVSANSQSSSALLQNEGSESKESRKGHFRTRSRSVGDLASQKMQTPKVLKSQLPVRQKLTSVPEATSIATDTALKSFSDDEGRSAKRNRTRYSLPINGAPGMTSYLAASLVRNLSGGESNRTSSAKSSLPINGAPETTSYLAASLVRSLSGGESNRTSSAESKNDRYSSMSVKEKQKFFEDQVSAKAESKNTV